MAEKRFAEACTAFEASQKLEPTMATLANLADCREKNGQYASAWSRFVELERQTRGDPAKAGLHRTAVERAAALEPRLSFLVVSVSDQNRVDGLVITRNGEPVDPLTWNRRLPVDGGEYVIEARAPGMQPWSTRVVVEAENDTQSVDVPKFEPLPPEPPPVEPAPDPVAAEGTSPPRSSRRKLVGLVVAGGGAAAVATGAVFGLLARDRWEEARGICGADLVCDSEADFQRADERIGDARLHATISTGLFIAGAAAIVSGAVLWFTAPSETSPPVRVTPVATGESAMIVLDGLF